VLGLALVSTWTYSLVSILLGLRLVLMWRRTRKLPELLIGLAFLLGGGLANALNVLRAAPGHRGSLDPLVLSFMLVGSSGSAIAIAVATWRVFRPDQGWARPFLLALCLCIVVTAGAYVATGRLAWNVGGSSARGAAFGWMAVESFLYHRRLQRQLRLGLTDVVVTDRMRLWAWASALVAVLWALFGLSRAAPALADPAVWKLLIAAPGLLCAGCQWLAFYPPSAYLRSVQRRRPAAVAPLTA
jgi:hypothetical protein